MLSKDLLKHQLTEDCDGSFYTGDDLDGSFYNGDDLDGSFYNGDDFDRRLIAEMILTGASVIEIILTILMEVMMDHQGRVLKISYSQEYKMVLYVERSQLKRLRKTKMVINGQSICPPGKDWFWKLWQSGSIQKHERWKAICSEGSQTAMTDVLREDDDDMLKRSPGTLVFYAPECYEGSAYHGRASDIWAVGVTLYCMISGHYPFLGDTLQEIRDKIVNDSVQIPGDMNPQLADLLQRLLCKDPGDRITLQAAAEHPWVADDKGPVPEYICRCGFGRRKRKDFGEEVQ